MMAVMKRWMAQLWAYLTRTSGDVLWSQVEKSVYEKLYEVIFLPPKKEKIIIILSFTHCHSKHADISSTDCKVFRNVMQRIVYMTVHTDV